MNKNLYPERGLNALWQKGKKLLRPAAGALLVALAPGLALAQTPAQYCTTNLHSVACSPTDNISSFVIENTTLNNSNTGCSGTGFTDYTTAPAANQTGTLIAGNAYVFSATTASPSKIAIWLDTNRDNIFGRTEFFQLSSASVAGSPAKLTLTIPAAFPTGPLRIRVRSAALNAVLADSSACSTLTSGETEDYIVTVAAAAPCPATVSAGTISGNLNICPNQRVDLLLTGYSPGSAIQWQFSNNGTTWQDYPGATSPRFLVPVPAGTFHFRTRVTCSGNSVNSASVQVVAAMPAPVTTYPFSENFDATDITTGIPCGWSITDANADTNTWVFTNNYSASAPNAFIYFYNAANTTRGGDDWLFTPALTFTAGKKYEVTFKYRAFQSGTVVYPEKLEVRFGNAATVAAMPASNIIFTNNNITNTTYATGTATIIGAPAGTYHIGFHAISAPDQLALALDDVTVTELAGCSGTPTAGTLPAGPITYCVGTTTLSTTGTTADAGIAYQWEESDDNGVTDPWASVTGGTGANTTSYLLPNNLTAPRYYRLKVTCNNTNQTVYTTSVQITIPSVSTFPYTENFDGVTAPALPCGWTSLDANNDTFTWKTTNTPGAASTAPNAATYEYNDVVNTNANDWLFSPALNLTGGRLYTLTFKYKAGSTTLPEKLSVYYGTNRDAASMLTNLIFTQDSINNNVYATATATGFSPAASGTYYIGFHITSSANAYSLMLDDVSIVETAGCTGAPTAGAPTVATLGLCAGTTSPITMVGATTGGGIIYQWEESDDNGVNDPWTNVTTGTGFNTVSFSPPANLTKTVYYRLKVTCANSSQTAVSTGVPVTVNPFNICYCDVDLHSRACSNTENITEVFISNTTLRNMNTGCTNTHGNGYTKYGTSPANLTATLNRNSTYRLNVTTTTSSIISAWIDYDQNGVFDANEWTQVATASPSNIEATVSITIPANALLGPTGMRIRSQAVGQANGATNACSKFGIGETEDYIVTIVNGTGLQEELAQALSVHPNPNNGIFQVNIKNLNAKNVSLRVVNALGQVVHTAPAGGDYSQELNLSHLATGIYMLQVEADGATEVRRISIQK